jgi:hypothetical protein
LSNLDTIAGGSRFGDEGPVLAGAIMARRLWVMVTVMVPSAGGAFRLRAAGSFGAACRRCLFAEEKLLDLHIPASDGCRAPATAAGREIRVA